MGIYTDQTFLHTCAKMQPTTISTSHVLAMYVPETNKPLKCNMQKDQEQIWDNYVRMYTLFKLSSIKNVTRSTDIHAYQITGLWPPYCIHMFHCNATLAYTWRDITVHISSKKKINKLWLLFTMLLPYMCQQICSSNAHMQISSYRDIGKPCQCRCLIWTQCNQQGNQEPWHTYIHIIGTCFWTNMSATLYIHVPLHFYSSIYIYIYIYIYIIYIYIYQQLKKTTCCNTYLPCFCHTCHYNKYAP